MEKEKLKEILHLHKQWLENEDGGICADLHIDKPVYAIHLSNIKEKEDGK